MVSGMGGSQQLEPSMSPPERDLTLAEVAELRRFTPRYLRDLIRRHHIPVLRSGWLIRLDALSLSVLEEALRCHSPSSVGNRPAPSRSAGLSRANAYAAALKATTPNSPPKRQLPLRPKSCERNGTANVVVL